MLDDKTPFQSFVDLVTLDQDIRRLLLKKEEIQNHIETLKQQLIALQDAQATAKRAVVDAQKHVDELELSMQIIQDQLDAKKRKLETLSNYKEYQPIKLEIDQLMREYHQKEDAVVQGWSLLERAQSEQETTYTDAQITHVRISEQIAQAEQEQNSLEAELKQLMNDRPNKEAHVPEEWLEKYAIMRTRVDDPVVQAIDEGCSACFQSIPGPDLMRLRKRALLQCRNCYRLLYMKEAMDKAVQEK